MRYFRTSVQAARIAFCAAFFLPATLTALPAHAAGLESFLSTFRECEYPGETDPFELFVRSLVERYRNDFSQDPQPAADRSNVKLEIPADLAGSIGPVTARNEGDHTLLSMPLKGSFEGLPVKALEFVFGNENGINTAVLVFNGSRADVVKTFGASIARGNAKGEAASADGAGYGAIIPEDEPGRIICDWST